MAESLREVVEEVAGALDAMALGFIGKDADERPDTMGPGLHPVTELIVNDLRGKASRLRAAVAAVPASDAVLDVERTRRVLCEMEHEARHPGDGIAESCLDCLRVADGLIADLTLSGVGSKSDG